MLQVRIIAQDRFLGRVRRQHIQDILDTDAHATDTGAAAAFTWLKGDTSQKVGFHG
jgi:hypothetical protein